MSFEPLTPAQLQGAVNIVAPGLHLDVEQRADYDAYDLHLGVKLNRTFTVTGLEMVNPQTIIGYVEDEAKALLSEARKLLKVDEDIDERVQRAHRLWERQVRPILLAAGLSPAVVEWVIEAVKEDIK